MTWRGRGLFDRAFALSEVSDDAEMHGILELWVADGLLYSVNNMSFGNDHIARRGVIRSRGPIQREATDVSLGAAVTRG